MEQFLWKWKNYIFFLGLIIIYLYLDYHTILFLRPQGIHFIRQTDSLSFAINYLKNGFEFFEPRVFNLNSVDGKAACEFPILYYITALLYVIFGEHEFILRLLSVIIVSFGFFSLFRLLNKLIRDTFYAMFFTFLFLSSGVLLYYTNNFIPDPGALGFTLSGWYFFYIFLENRKRKKPLILAFLFFLLGSLLKVTYFLNPLSAILTVLIFDFSKKKKLNRIIKENLQPLLIFLISAILAGSWSLYAIHYNKTNHDYYFLVTTCPIWEMSKEDILQIFDYMSNYWFPDYFYKSAFHVYLAISALGLFFINKTKKTVLITASFLTMGSLSFWLLFLAQFKNHDYYFLTLMPAIIFIVINSFIALRNNFPWLVNNLLAKAALLILFIFSISHAHKKLDYRYATGIDNLSKIGVKLADTRHMLDSLGVSEIAKCAVFTDFTANGGLYFINRPGWNIADTTETSIKRLNNCVKQGLEFIISIEKEPVEFDFEFEKIAENKEVTIYKIVN